MVVSSSNLCHHGLYDSKLLLSMSKLYKSYCIIGAIVLLTDRLTYATNIALSCGVIATR